MRAIFSVTVDGQDITANLTPVLTSLKVEDKAGQSSDSASIEIDDTGGKIVMPGPGARMSISLGWEGRGVGVVFEGIVDTITADGGRNGRTLSIGAKGMDTRGKAKQGQHRHFDDATIEEALSAAGEAAGISVAVDPSFASIVRPYIAMDNESFVAFGERLAHELGGTFKIVGERAILARRNGGVSLSGAPLPVVRTVWGGNLHSYSIAPIIGRPVEKETSSRWFNKYTGEWEVVKAETGTADAATEKSARFTEPDVDRAQEQAGSDAAESDRKSGEGSVVIEGNIDAQPEGTCEVAGCRPGVDGTYRIESVSHEHSRSGFTTTLQLRQPKGGAGQDARA